MSRKFFFVLVIGLAALFTGCGPSASAPAEQAPVPTATPIVVTGVGAVDDKTLELTEAVTDNTCNLSLFGIGGMTVAVQRLAALENCDPAEDEQAKYDMMVISAEEDIAAQ